MITSTPDKDPAFDCAFNFLKTQYKTSFQSKLIYVQKWEAIMMGFGGHAVKYLKYIQPPSKPAFGFSYK